MKKSINLLPQKKKKELKEEKLTFMLDVIATTAIIIVELFSFFFILYSNGIHSKLVVAKTEYNKNLSNLNHFSNIESLINNVNQRYSDILTIQNNLPNPIKIINLLEKNVPSNVSISNIEYSYPSNLQFTCTTTDVLTAAKFMYNFASYNPNNKYFINTQIQSVSIDQSNNSVTFTVSSQYNGPK